MSMQSMTGAGTIAFPDGEIFDVTVDVGFTLQRGLSSGSGSVESEDLMEMAMKPGRAILEVSGRKIAVIITAADSDGTGSLITTGPPID